MAAISPRQRAAILAQARTIVSRYGLNRAERVVLKAHERRNDELYARHGRDGFNSAVMRDRKIDRYVRLSRVIMLLRREAGRERERSLPDLDRLVWNATRSGSRGTSALAVLQDALLERYSPDFVQAQKQATRLARSHRGTHEYVVVFKPWIVHWNRVYAARVAPYLARGERPAEPGSPFEVRRRLGRGRHLREFPVWSTESAFDVHAQMPERPTRGWRSTMQRDLRRAS